MRIDLFRLFLLLAVVHATDSQANAGPGTSDLEVEKQVRSAEQAARTRIDRDVEMKRLTQKHTPILLHAFAPEKDGGSSFSFVYETKYQKKHNNCMDLRMFSVDKKIYFEFPSPNFLAIRLGPVDFEKDINPKSFAINHPGILTSAREIIAKERDVYLQRVRDSNGSDFFVIFQLLVVEPNADYMVFIWRKLPGGKHIK